MTDEKDGTPRGGDECRLWRIENVEEFLDVPRRRVFELIHDEGLPCVTLGKTKRQVRFISESVIAWLEAREHGDLRASGTTAEPTVSVSTTTSTNSVPASTNKRRKTR